MRYIFYKIFNLFMIKVHKKYFYSDILFSKKPIDLGSIKSILFDFSHHSTHLGDRLFFFPLVRSLQESGIEILFSEYDKITKELYLSMDQTFLFTAINTSKQHDLVVIPAPSLLAKTRDYINSNLLICNFTDVKDKNILEELALGFKKAYKNKHLDNIYIVNQDINFINKLNTDCNYFIYSNYIDSGSFRKYFINKKSLALKAIELKEGGCKLIHVGSKSDLRNDESIYNFIDIDLRGELSIPQLIQLIGNNKIKGVISYDNFIMHLSGMFNKKAYILFRGRFLKKNIISHIRFINIVFFTKKNRIIYLNKNLYEHILR